jgi:hypothetical protein
LGAKRDPTGFSYFLMNATHCLASWLGSQLDAISQLGQVIPSQGPVPPPYRVASTLWTMGGLVPNPMMQRQGDCVDNGGTGEALVERKPT